MKGNEMSDAHNYQVYSKDAGGRITRKHRVIVESDLTPYTHYEKLTGWPEEIVYWRVMGDGSCIGVSPDSDAAAQALASLDAAEIR